MKKETQIKKQVFKILDKINEDRTITRSLCPTSFVSVLLNDLYDGTKETFDLIKKNAFEWMKKENLTIEEKFF